MENRNNMRRIKEIYSPEYFRIKDWKSERGEKLHPLLKDGPLVNLGLKYVSELSKLENEIIAHEKNEIDRGEFYNMCSQDGKEEKAHDHSDVSYIETRINGNSDLGKKINAVFKDILLENQYNDIVTIRYTAGSEKKDIQTAVWHMDAIDADIMRLMVYLVDVDDDQDGPFEHVETPEKYYYDASSLAPLGIDIGHWLVELDILSPNNSYYHLGNKIPGVKLYGKKFSTFIFSPFFPHTANAPIRKDRLAIMMNIPTHNSFNKNI